NAVNDEQKKKDAFEILKIMKEMTGNEPKMWGSSIIGFGTRHYKYASGREGDWPIAGFSPRKQNLTLYLGMGEGFDPELLKNLGKHSLGKGCLYFKRVSDVHLPTLKRLIKICVKKQKQKG